ncbi:MAG: hypothetical protein ACQEUT_09540 [Bacillota bacterium]
MALKLCECRIVQQLVVIISVYSESLPIQREECGKIFKEVFGGKESE